MRTVKKIKNIALALGFGTVGFLLITNQVLTITAFLSLCSLSILLINIGVYFSSQFSINSDLYVAASKGNRLWVKYLLFLGANPNYYSDPLSEAIQKCSQFDNRGIIEDLLKAGANVNKHNRSFNSYLSKALNINTPFGDEAVKILLKWGADPNVRAHSYYNALFKAAALGRSEIIEDLIRAGVRIDEHNENGETALSTAVEHAQFNTVKALLELGADTTLKRGQTVLEKAIGRLMLKKFNSKKSTLQCLNEMEKIIELLQQPKEEKEVRPLAYPALGTHSTLPELADEVMVHIFSYLSAKEVVRASMASKTWQRIASDSFLWKTLCLRDVPPTHPIQTKNIDWKKNYAIYVFNANLAADKLKLHFQKTLLFKHSLAHKNYVALSPDGSKLVEIVSNTKNQIKLWDTVTGKCLRVISIEKNEFAYEVAFSKDGSKIIARSHSYFGIWDLDGTLLLLIHIPATTKYAISPNGTQLLLSNPGHSQIKLYALPTNRLNYLATFGTKNEGDLIAFSCDQKILTTNKKEINLWDINHLEAPLFTLPLPSDSIAFSQDGTLFAAGISLDNQAWEIQLFETETGKFIKAFPLYDVRPYKIHFLLHDKMVCCEDFYSFTYFFNIDTGKMEGWRQGQIASSGHSFLDIFENKARVSHYVPRPTYSFRKKCVDLFKRII